MTFAEPPRSIATLVEHRADPADRLRDRLPGVLLPALLEVARREEERGVLASACCAKLPATRPGVANTFPAGRPSLPRRHRRPARDAHHVVREPEPKGIPHGRNDGSEPQVSDQPGQQRHRSSAPTLARLHAEDQTVHPPDPNRRCRTRIRRPSTATPRRAFTSPGPSGASSPRLTPPVRSGHAHVRGAAVPRLDRASVGRPRSREHFATITPPIDHGEVRMVPAVPLRRGITDPAAIAANPDRRQRSELPPPRSSA